MRLISFEADGKTSFGLVENDGVIDAAPRLGRPTTTLRDLLLAGEMDRLRPLQGMAADYKLSEIRYLPPIFEPAAKFLCVGVNYMPHIEEMGRDKPEYPVLFVRFADSLVGHQEALVKPRVSDSYDFEGELAVVIGQRARHVPAADAMNFIAGYSCFNDGSVRDYQRHGPQWTPGKNFHRSGAFGPWLVTADEAGDPAEFRLRTALNGQVVQDENLAELCFGIPQLIEYCTRWVQLQPGDVIATGTPGGVGAGRTPPLWMKAGDRVEVDITGVGRLVNPVVDENGA